jgi:hypothetical protein
LKRGCQRVSLERFKEHSTAELVGTIRSPKFIEDFLVCNHTDSNKCLIFAKLCSHEHLSVAQWFYHHHLHSIILYIHVAFHWVCFCGHLQMAQWLYSLYSLGDIFMRRRKEHSLGLV